MRAWGQGPGTTSSGVARPRSVRVSAWRGGRTGTCTGTLLEEKTELAEALRAGARARNQRVDVCVCVCVCARVCVCGGSSQRRVSPAGAQIVSAYPSS